MTSYCVHFFVGSSGRCFFEDAVKQKLRVLGILPKAHLWWISAARHAPGGFRGMKVSGCAAGAALSMI
jgi:hypothetical protein